MTTTADPVAAQPASPVAQLDDATAIARAGAPTPFQRTTTTTVAPAPFDTPGVSYMLYKADAHGATPLAWRCRVNGPQGVSADIPLADVGVDVTTALARLYLAAVGT